MEALLKETRKINRVIQQSVKQSINFTEIAKILSHFIEANVYMVDVEREILGYKLINNFECDLISKIIGQGKLPQNYNEAVLDFDITETDFKEEIKKCIFTRNKDCLFINKSMITIPINAGGERLGNLIITRLDGSFDSSDLILAEYGTTVVGRELLMVRSENLEQKARERASVYVVLDTLSHSELEVVQQVITELDGKEDQIVASRIADELGIARSILVNALRKLESGEIIESRSLGRKGTYIKILNDRLFEEMENLEL